MIKKLFALAIIVISLFIIGTVVGTLVYQTFHPQTATVSTLSLTVYLDGVEWANETTIDWGSLNASETYYFNLTVLNSGGVSANVSLIISGLPTGWSETWAGNNTVLAPGEWVYGDLDLTVASDADGTYNWESWIRGEQS